MDRPLIAACLAVCLTGVPGCRWLTEGRPVEPPPVEAAGKAATSKAAAGASAGTASDIAPADEARLRADLRSPVPGVRLGALRAWAADRRVALPAEAAERRTDGDWRVRAAALEALAARRHPQAGKYLAEALHDHEIQVRTAAIAGLGVLGDAHSQAALTELLKERSDGIRSEAVAALARAGAKQTVLDAAADQSWRVRLKVAQALAAYPDRDGAAVATRLLDDPSAAVQQEVVVSAAQWPLAQAGPVLLEAMARPAFLTRKTAAERLAARWPAAADFPVEGPASRRGEVLEELKARFRQQFSPVDRAAFARAVSPARTTTDPALVGRVEQLLQQHDVQGLADFGPGLVESLEQLALDRQQVLPEAVYRDVLPRYDPVFASVERLASADVAQRRRAAEELSTAGKKQPLGRLATARLAALVAAEADPLVWQWVLEAVAADPTEPAARLAYAAISHPSAEVRRRACAHLAAHPAAEHARILVPALGDANPLVAVAAIHALAALDRLDDTRPLRQLLASRSEELQVEAAIALVQVRDFSGIEALQRLSYSNDWKIRARVAQGIGEAGSRIRTAKDDSGAMKRPPLMLASAILWQLLDDRRTDVVRAVLIALPKLIPSGPGQDRDGPPPGITEQVRQWKEWQKQQHIGRAYNRSRGGG